MLVTLVVTGLAIGWEYLHDPVYTSDARVEVRALTNTGQLQGNPGLVGSMGTEAEKVTSPAVIALAAPSLQAAGIAVDDVADAVDVTVPADSTLLDIACTQPTPEMAEACTNALTEAYIVDRRDGAKLAFKAAQVGPTNAYRAAKAEFDALSSEVPTTAEEAANIQRQMDVAANEMDAAYQQLHAIPTPSLTPAVTTVPGSLPQDPSNRNDLAVARAGRDRGPGAGSADRLRPRSPCPTRWRSTGS